MRQSFTGFLTQYCQELTETQTRSLKAFFAKACEDCPRAAEPVLLLALVQERETYLLKLARGRVYEKPYRDFVRTFRESNLGLEEFLRSQEAPERFRKIYASYESKAHKLERDREVLEHLFPQINDLINKTELTRYEVSRALDLNKGNLYAFLKGDVGKMSRETAMRVYQFLISENAEAVS